MDELLVRLKRLLFLNRQAVDIFTEEEKFSARDDAIIRCKIAGTKILEREMRLNQIRATRVK